MSLTLAAFLLLAQAPPAGFVLDPPSETAEEWPGEPVVLPPGCRSGDASCDPWAEFRPTDEVVWVLAMSGSIYHVLKSEVRRDDPTRGSVTFWMHGDHHGSEELRYQRSLRNITLNCDGRMRFNASTALKDDGTIVFDSDVQGPWVLIRPTSMWQSAEAELCSPPTS